MKMKRKVSGRAITRGGSITKGGAITKGGSITKGGAIADSVIPFETYGYPDGAGSASQAAYLNQKNANLLQTQMNKGLLNGGGETVTVPQFPPIGGINSPNNLSLLSKNGNTAFLNLLNDAQNDCYATNSCVEETVGGSRRHKRKSHKKKKSLRKKKKSLRMKKH